MEKLPEVGTATGGMSIMGRLGWYATQLQICKGEESWQRRSTRRSTLACEMVRRTTSRSSNPRACLAVEPVSIRVARLAAKLPLPQTEMVTEMPVASRKARAQLVAGIEL